MSEDHPPEDRSAPEAWFGNLLFRNRRRVAKRPAGLGSPRHLVSATVGLLGGLEEGRRRLEDGSKKLGAASCTFYVRDPWWPDEHRLLYMIGVTITEPMYGFLFPASAKQVITSGPPEEYFQYPADAEGPRANPPALFRKLDDEKRVLFESFARREGVKSCARLLHRDGGGVAATLFVNFASRTEFTADLKKEIRNLMREMTDLLPVTTAELLQTSPLPAAQIIRILQPVQELANFGLRQGPHSQRECLGSILEAALAAFDIRPETGLGTIHLYKPETQTLQLEAFKGRIDNLDDTCVQSVAEGDGVIAWVAIKRQAIFIDNLETSPFRRIHRRIRDGGRSQLAVPMMAGDRLLGVVNLESIRPAAFPSSSVRILWYAASQAAIACHLYQQATGQREQADFTDQLLRLCQEAATDPDAAGSHLDDLAGVARDALKATVCYIWSYNAAEGRFDPAGATDYGFEASAQPRAQGWSHFILRHRRPVWITNVRDESHFDVFFWDQERGVWENQPLGEGPPRTINQHLPAHAVRCELGVPILLGEDCIGVAWFKYETDETPPSPKAILWAAGIAGEAALVLRNKSFFPSGGIMSLADLFTQRAAAVINRHSRPGR
jgi:GAF domain-containing protein